jgi:hypothetical protein
MIHPRHCEQSEAIHFFKADGGDHEPRKTRLGIRKKAALF